MYRYFRTGQILKKKHMTKYYTFLFFIFSLLSSAQDKILFSYDNAGNQILREICINCTARTTSKPVKELKKEDLIEIDQISYYPNPVIEELFLSWKLVPEKTVQKIEVFTISGKSLQGYLPQSDQITIGFSGYPSGIYFVHFNYNNGEVKTIKIIKK